MSHRPFVTEEERKQVTDVDIGNRLPAAQHTQKWEIGDLRQIPLVMPTKAQAERLEKLAEQATEAKRLTFTGGDVSHALVASVRDLSRQLLDSAPACLRPSAQTMNTYGVTPFLDPGVLTNGMRSLRVPQLAFACPWLGVGING